MAVPLHSSARHLAVALSELAVALGPLMPPSDKPRQDAQHISIQGASETSHRARPLTSSRDHASPFGAATGAATGAAGMTFGEATEDCSQAQPLPSLTSDDDGLHADVAGSTAERCQQVTTPLSTEAETDPKAEAKKWLDGVWPNDEV